MQWTGRRYQSIVESVPCGIVDADTHGNIEFCNGTFTALLGYGNGELIGMWIGDLAADEISRNILSEIIQKLDDDSSRNEDDIRLLARTGHEVECWTQWSIRFDARHHPCGVIFVFQRKSGRAKEHVDPEDLFEERAAELIRTSERYCLAAEAARVGVWDWNIERSEFYVDPLIRAVLGYRDDKQTHDIADWVSAIYQGDRESVMMAVQDHLEGRTEQFSIEQRMMHRDGSIYWMLIRGSAIRDEKGKGIRMLGTCTDITERKVAEELLNENKEFLRSILDNVRDAIGLLDLETRRYTYRSPFSEMVFGISPDDPVAQPFGYSMTPERRDELLQILEDEIVHDAERDPNRSSMFEILVKNQRDGTDLWIESKATFIRDSSGKPRYLLTLDRDITERKMVEEELARYREQLEQLVADRTNELRYSEERYRKLIEFSPDALIVHTDGIIEFVNESCLRMFSKTPEQEDPIGKKILDYVHPESKGMAIERYRRLQKVDGSNPLVEMKFVKTDGEPFYGEITSTPFSTSSGERKIMVKIHDITERKMMEEALRESEKRYRFLYERSPSVAVIIDKDGAISDANDSFLVMMGRERDEVIGRSALDFVVEEQHEEVADEIFRALMGDPGGSQMEIGIRSRSGEIRTLLLSPGHAFLQEGEEIVGVLATGIDITDRKKAEGALRSSEEKYRHLVEDINDVIYSFDNKGVLTYVSPAVRFFGYTPEEVIGDPVNNFIYEEDMPVVIEGVQRVLSGGEPIPTEFRVFTRTGEIRWLRGLGKSIYDGERVVGSRGVLTDISDQKQAEMALKYRVEFEKIITAIATEFINIPSDEIDVGIDRALRTVGEFADIHRNYIFIISEDRQSMYNSHEWCAGGVASRKDDFQRVALADFPWFAEKIEKCEVIHIPAVKNLPADADAERRQLEQLGIHSIILVPMISRGVPIGFLGMDSVSVEKSWPDDIDTLLKILAEIFVNLLDRKRKEEALNRYEHIVSSSTELIAFIDGSGIFRAINEAFLAALGKARDEVVDKSLVDVFDDELYENYLREHCERCMNGNETQFEGWFDFINLGERYMEISLYPFIDRNAVQGVILNLRDITDWVDIEKEILEISTRERRQIGLDLHDGLGHFLLGIAIQARVLAQRLGGEGLDAVSDALEIEENINRAIEKTRSLAKGLFPIHLENIGFSEMVMELVDAMPVDDIKFQIRIDRAVEKCDIKILRHIYFVIEEAVLNAVKHAGANRIGIRLTCRNGYGVLRIRDDGIGIPEECERDTGMGLSLMKYRARLISASLNIARLAKGGTEIICRFRLS